MEFVVKLDRFEGPYTKLLDLIEQKKLSITEISLVTVSDDYMAYIKSIDKKNFSDISQFIVVASTLMLMKAKSLLPDVNYTDEEEKQIHDLELKLELYSMLVSASNKIKSIFMKRPLFSRPYATFKGSVFVSDDRITGEYLRSIAEITLSSFIPPKQLVKIAIEQAMRIENVIEKMLERVKSMQSVALSSLVEGVKSVEEKKKLLIINFIALLELLKSGSVNVEQGSYNGDITILKT